MASWLGFWASGEFSVLSIKLSSDSSDGGVQRRNPIGRSVERHVVIPESSDSGRVPRSKNLDSLLERIEERIGEELREPAALVFQIKQLLDAYLEAKAATIVAKVSEAAEKAGITFPSTGEPAAAESSEDLAKALLALIGNLPELRAPLTEIRAEPLAEEVGVVAAAEAAVGALPVEAAAPRRTASVTPRIFTDPEIEALWREFQAIDFDSLEDKVFKPWAEELACRGRALQARGLNDQTELLTRLFRVLTAKAFERNIRDVFGLARNHHGDWTVRAERAMREREQAQNPTPRRVTTKIEIPQVLRAAVAAEEAADSEDNSSNFPDVPRLRALCAQKPLVLLGGTIEPEKLTRLKKQLGTNVDWVETSDGNTQGIGALATRVRTSRVGAVVVLEELIGHRHFAPVVSAARESNPATPVGYGKKAGTLGLKSALETIEKLLSSQE